MKVFIKSELKNIAPRYHRAIWRKYRVMQGYPSAKVASKYHNLKNCDYVIGENKHINNANIDCYGNRYSTL